MIPASSLDAFRQSLFSLHFSPQHADGVFLGVLAEVGA